MLTNTVEAALDYARRTIPTKRQIKNRVRPISSGSLDRVQVSVLLLRTRRLIKNRIRCFFRGSFDLVLVSVLRSYLLIWQATYDVNKHVERSCGSTLPGEIESLQRLDIELFRTSGL